MAHYQVTLESDELGIMQWEWEAQLFIELEDGSLGEQLSAGVGHTADEAMRSLDLTRYVIELDNNHNIR